METRDVPNRCDAAIRVNGDRCTHSGRSAWEVSADWTGPKRKHTKRMIWLCGTHLRALGKGFSVWDIPRITVNERNARRVVAA